MLFFAYGLFMKVGNHEYDHTGGGLDKDPSGVKKKDGYRPIWGKFLSFSSTVIVQN